MQRGNLSTKLAPIIGVRFEHVIYNFGKVNTPGKAFCEDLLSKDINLYFITTLHERKTIAWCYKWGVAYTRVLEAASTLEIPDLCRHHKIALYIDTDTRLLEAVGMTPTTQPQLWEQSIGSTKSTSYQTD